MTSRALRIGVVVAAAVIAAGLGIRRRLRSTNPTSGAQPAAAAGQVQALVTLAGDSILVVGQWALADSAAPPSTTRFYYDGDQHTTSRQSDGRSGADTLLIPEPQPGSTATGHLCLEAGTRLSCTPWQFVRPAARAVDSALGRRIERMVIRPEGLQVDPDINGTCANWRAAHPDESPWVEVNARAVPACTGPNGRPTLAQFCAFAVLTDGRRVETAAARKTPYCRDQFREWAAERRL